MTVAKKLKKSKTTLAIIGFGLLGSSLGLALKNRGYKRIGWSRRPESRKKALQDGVVDRVFDNPTEAISEADITVVCLPVPNIISFCAENVRNWKKGAVVSDVGSIKKTIVDKLTPLFEKHGIQFVGSHPMAGSEKSGAEAAYAEIYQGATVFLTPTEDNTEKAVGMIRKLWENAGAMTVGLSSKEHDLLVAYTSHLPHMVALALVKTVLDCDKKNHGLKQLGCAGGFRDATRIASSPPQMWREIIENNKDSALKALSDFIKTMDGIREMMENNKYDSFESELLKGKKLRDLWLESYIARINPKSRN